MALIEFSDLPAFSITDSDIHEPWIVVVETFRDASHLRIRADGEWTFSARADGHAGLRFQPDQVTLPNCPLGALIGKIGGSSASLFGATGQPAAADAAGAQATPATEGRPFAIGTLCIVPMPTGSIGPLFVAFNGLARPVHVASLTVTVGTACITP